MTKNLKKRIITSILLFIFAILFILINEIFFLFIVFVVLYLCVTEWYKLNWKYFRKKKWEYNLITAIGIIYAFLVLFTIRNLRGDSFEDAIFLIFILSLCVCSDIGGYVFGKTIGGKKLTKISPNITLSGSIGSFIFSILPIFLFNFQNYININFYFSLKNILFCLIISLVCQLGDLFISYFKRLNKVKDTGSILPGHGGLLDRIDGIIFAIPTASILKLSQIF